MARRSLVLLRNDGTPAPGRRPVRRRRRRASPTGTAEPSRSWARTPTIPTLSSGTGPAPPGRSTGCPTATRARPSTTVLDGFRAIAPANWTITYARGADIGRLVPDPAGEHLPGRPTPTPAVRAGRGSNQAMLQDGRPRCPGGGLGRRRARRHRRPDRRRAARPRRSSCRAPRSPCSTQLAATGTPVIVVLIQSKPSRPARLSIHACRGRDRGVQPRHAGRPGDRRAHPRAHRTQRSAPDHVRPPRRAASRVLQPDPRAARRPIRRPHAGARSSRSARA